MIQLICDYIIPCAYELLPEKMNYPESTAMLIAIGLQESKFQHRVQVNGPAHGFWQFELGGGCKGVITHPSSANQIKQIMVKLGYPDPTARILYDAIIDNDVLAAVAARLLLWTDPRKMPTQSDGPDASWNIYNSVWRPGRPHRETWNKYHKLAWDKVKEI